MDNILTLDQTQIILSCIADKAGEIINAVHMRRDHPTYGYTKAIIKTKRDELDGMIGLFMVLSGQSATPNASHLAIFPGERTAERVKLARELVDTI